jgi:hypothetical protein
MCFRYRSYQLHLHFTFSTSKHCSPEVLLVSVRHVCACVCACRKALPILQYFISHSYKHMRGFFFLPQICFEVLTAINLHLLALKLSEYSVHFLITNFRKYSQYILLNLPDVNFSHRPTVPWVRCCRV